MLDIVSISSLQWFPVTRPSGRTNRLRFDLTFLCLVQFTLNTCDCHLVWGQISSKLRVCCLFSLSNCSPFQQTTLLTQIIHPIFHKYPGKSLTDKLRLSVVTLLAQPKVGVVNLHRN